MLYTLDCLHPYDILDMTINQKMSAVDCVAYFALRNCKPSNQQLSVGILETNALSVGALPRYNSLFLCVCKYISCINHRYNGSVFTYEYPT